MLPLSWLSERLNIWRKVSFANEGYIWPYNCFESRTREVTLSGWRRPHMTLFHCQWGRVLLHDDNAPNGSPKILDLKDRSADRSVSLSFSFFLTKPFRFFHCVCIFLHSFSFIRSELVKHYLEWPRLFNKKKISLFTSIFFDHEQGKEKTSLEWKIRSASDGKMDFLQSARKRKVREGGKQRKVAIV